MCKPRERAVGLFVCEEIRGLPTWLPRSALDNFHLDDAAVPRCCPKM